MYPDLVKENRRMSTCNRLDLQTLGSQPVMPKKIPQSLLWSLPRVSKGKPKGSQHVTSWAWKTLGFGPISVPKSLGTFCLVHVLDEQAQFVDNSPILRCQKRLGSFWFSLVTF